MQKSLTENEVQIFDARETGKSFCDLSPVDFDISITGVIFKISVICGCQLPTHPAHIEALEKEFGIFLNENGYSGLTLEEVLLAFRMNANFKLGTKVESYGAIFNINYAAQVLRLYRDKRGIIDQAAERIIYSDDVEQKLQMEANARRTKIINQFEIFLNDKAELDLSNCFMQLREDGAFSNKNIPDDGTKYFRGSTEVERLLNSFESLDTRFLKEQASVRYLFENMKLTGKLKIYDDKFKLLYPNFELPERFDVSENKKEF